MSDKDLLLLTGIIAGSALRFTAEEIDALFVRTAGTLDPRDALVLRAVAEFRRKLDEEVPHGEPR